MQNYDWLQDIEHLARKYAEAKANRTYLEHFRHTKLAQLATQAELEDPKRYKSCASREEYSRQHKDYIEVLEGLQEAVKIEETCKWSLKQKEWRFEAWRSELSFAKSQIPRGSMIT